MLTLKIFIMKHFLNKKGAAKILVLVAMVLAVTPAMAEGPRPVPSVSNPFVLLLIIIACILALIIAVLAKTVIGAAGIFIEKEKTNVKGPAKNIITPVIIAALLLAGNGVFAQASTDSTGAAAKVNTASLSSISDTAYYMLSGVIFTELLLIVVLLYMLRVFVNVKKKAAVAGVTATEAIVVTRPKITLWDKLNKLKPIHEEADIDLGHNYDGIRELDNRLPPWWIYGFYITIVFALGYMYMHHISHSLPSNLEQYQAEVAEGEAQKTAYLKKAANNVDEATVTLLTDATSIDAGKQVFAANCFACHGKLGEGGVGPNLTDNYWLHGGTIKEIFKTIKYGWPDKGMKSWKDDFSPVQLQQIASYVHSLQGTKPPNAKAPQGVPVVDSIIIKGKDSTIARR